MATVTSNRMVLGIFQRNLGATSMKSKMYLYPEMDTR